MSIKIAPFITALQQGRQLTNAAAWKSGAVKINLASILVTIITAILPMFGVTIPLPDAAVAAIAGLIATGVYNVYVHLATSKTVGLRTKSKPPTIGAAPPTDNFGI